MVYGGTIRAGCSEKFPQLDIISAFQSYGEKLYNRITEEERIQIIENACPGPGACGGMYTANTMATAIEALGMSLPYSSSSPADDSIKLTECKLAGEAVLNLLKKDIKPRDIMTKKAFENAITLVMILGGSTNAVLHLIAMARSVNVDLTLDDFQRISDQTPLLADLKPSGKYVMEDLQGIGGTPAVLRFLLDNGMIHGDCLTVTGQTIRENLENVKPIPPDNPIIRMLSNPIKQTGHLQILYGNLSPEGSVAKITGKEGLTFTGVAKVYDSEELMMEGLKKKEIVPGMKCQLGM
jgi:dihydroxy-acid dehydratase